MELIERVKRNDPEISGLSLCFPTVPYDSMSFLIGNFTLKILSISGNDLVDISFLTDNRTLTHLFAGHNKIVDISGLKGNVTLEHIDLCKNKIVDASPLCGTRATALELRLNKIRDINFMKGNRSVFNLGIYGNRIRDVSPLRDNRTLTYLNIGKNLIEDFSPLIGNTSLIYLDPPFNITKDSKLTSYLHECTFMNRGNAYNRRTTLRFISRHFLENEFL
jgi:Leucine-rich repeat (LRR) protein